MMLRVLRNIAIIALLALAIAVVPGGGDLAEALITALVMGFLAAIAFAVYRIFRQNSFAYMSLSDGWQATVIVAVGAIVLMIAGTDELLATGLGLAVWLAVLGGAIFTLVRAWGEAQS
jgi:Kef-type K+ transport system membrane component KefB